MEATNQGLNLQRPESLVVVECYSSVWISWMVMVSNSKFLGSWRSWHLLVLSEAWLTVTNDLLQQQPKDLTSSTIDFADDNDCYSSFSFRLSSDSLERDEAGNSCPKLMMVQPQEEPGFPGFSTQNDFPIVSQERKIKVEVSLKLLTIVRFRHSSQCQT